ncbi:flavin reductase family protein [Salinibacterium sp. ZJ450]|uniref:flavin reductase family protein n=1 Tax=Salinibacterium sp. ZJ450 TaxID=2708338 RepID=UPI0014228AE3|nr:flavin reductase family protein [Salinibacterium sp. ZJ450]
MPQHSSPGRQSPVGALQAADRSTLNGFLSLTPDEFKHAFRNHAAGVSVVTADDGSGPVGLTATSVFSVSIEPLLVFSVSDLSSSAPVIKSADTVVVHLLGSAQLDIAKLCATSGIDRFADTGKWSRLVTGEPLFHDADVWIRGRVINRMTAGSSTVIAVHALQTNVGTNRPEAEPSSPLVYHNRNWHELGEKSRIRS